MKKFGFVSILGLPNAGKSTLVNALVGSKVSIVSNKPQTTRCRILGIAMNDEAQIILMDAPGIFAPRRTLDKAMVDAAWGTLEECDVVIHIVDATNNRALDHNKIIIDRLDPKKPTILILNKTDQANKGDLLTQAEAFNKSFSYHSILMISALNKDRVEDVLTQLTDLVPEGEWHFDPENTSDIPARFMAAEMTREKIFHQLHEELPYAALVETESWEEFDNGDVRISQVIYVQRETQKAIVVGKGGSRIKEIGEAARLELEEIFGRKVHLKLFVKVQENWPERAENFSLVGLSDQR